MNQTIASKVETWNDWYFVTKTTTPLTRASGVVLFLRIGDYFPIILNMPVPQVGHSPFIAFLPFFIVASLAFFMSFLDLHFTQYASMSWFLRFVMHKSKFYAHNKQTSRQICCYFFQRATKNGRFVGFFCSQTPIL
ncbi:MAG TPA: hypothetical protein PKL92_07915 [Aquaticitalea sp.]|nr:hypothetical protein [Aquaticitalea sp.]HNU60016.1 hypothetical protein [Aquaticitalea sp.]